MKIKCICFDWYGINKDNPASFGQITLLDADGEKLDVINLDLKYEDLFLLIYSLFKEHIANDIECVYETVI